MPILRGFPAKYIYDPWNAPESIQKAAKCVIGVNYPKPMVNHAEASRLNIERMKQIYQQLSRYRGLGMTVVYFTYLSEDLSPLQAIDVTTCSVAMGARCEPSVSGSLVNQQKQIIKAMYPSNAFLFPVTQLFPALCSASGLHLPRKLVLRFLLKTCLLQSIRLVLYRLVLLPDRTTA